MCFSPEASFTGGVIISVIGVLAVRKVKNPSQILFASIPLFFGLQQFAEGILWFTLGTQGYVELQKITTYIFLIMALVIWPMMIPLSVLFLEVIEKKKIRIRILLFIGISLSVYYTYCLLSCNVSPIIKNYHIQYENDFPESLAMIAFLFYLTATIPPLFVSSVKRLRIFGTLMTLSCLTTILFFTQYLTSVWCFFAALISGVVYWILYETEKDLKSEIKASYSKINP